MDEPFSSLDVELRQRLGHEVRRILKASGTTAILVTHDQQEAFAIADRVGVMHDGNLEQWDRPYELYHRPATRYVAADGAEIRHRVDRTSARPSGLPAASSEQTSSRA